MHLPERMPPPMPIAEFCREVWKQQIGTEAINPITRDTAIDLWFAACEQHLDEVMASKGYPRKVGANNGGNNK